jgi:hypothetical protein
MSFPNRVNTLLQDIEIEFSSLGLLFPIKLLKDVDDYNVKLSRGNYFPSVYCVTKYVNSR